MANTNYNSDMGQAIAIAIASGDSHEAQAEAVYTAMADKGWLVSQDDCENQLNIVTFYEENREA